MDRTTEEPIFDYISNAVALSNATDRVVHSDGLDFRPLAVFSKIISEKTGRVFVITPTDESAADLYSDYEGDRDVLLLLSDSKRLYSEYTNSDAETKRRIALFEMYSGKKPVIVTSLRAFSSPVISPRFLTEGALKIEKGGKFNPTYISASLTEMGYARTENCYDPLTFSVRGEVIDIFPASAEKPFRIYGEWEGIERIREFDPMTQKASADVESLSVMPVSDSSLVQMGVISDYLKDDDYFIVSGFERTEAAWKGLTNESSQRMSEPGSRPGRILDYLKFIESLKRGLIIHDISKDEYFHFGVGQSRSYFGNLEYFKQEASSLIDAGWDLTVAVPSVVQKERVDSLLKSLGIRTVVSGIDRGFQIEKIRTLVTLDSEIFGRKKRVRSVKESLSAPLDSFIELKSGDYVVHVRYGIGRFLGIDRVKQSRNERDYIIVEYLNNDLLYVPIEQADLVQKYIGNEGREPKLDSLTSLSWKRRKEKARRSAEKLAARLVVLYAKRESMKGFRFLADDEIQSEFEASFPYTETEDQINALNDVKQDMESDRVMDRLILGDVGFGKTEIAFRAAMKAALSGKQVAFLSPTVILADQHYENFMKRINRFPVTAALLSRYVQPKDRRKVIEDVSAGRVDVLFGTHRIIQSDVVFNDLGLLIIDEEQRFGVKAKERIKEIKNNVDSLSLSATPIPRTLYMSLLKVRDLSLIKTAPKERKSIETYVGKFSSETASMAIRSEIGRGGQVFFLHNRIDDIEDTVEMVKRLVPEAIVESAHGRMGSVELEDTMHRFIYGGIQVLVSTTIIENGIDIPNVNTIIVDRAERYGLSQLYQLRGRVGRSERRAYCYLFYRENSDISEDAVKRLKILSENTSLGSGFIVSMKDMEMRGSGNILGMEQSGHMEAVGLDMYMRMLEEEIMRLTDKDNLPPGDVLVELEYTGFIGDDYIADQSAKFEVYRKIASATTESEAEQIREELEDRYGKLTEEVENLLSIAEIKIICRGLSIREIKEKKGCIDMTFSNNSKIDVDRIISLVTLGDGRFSLDPRRPNVLRLRTEDLSLKDKSLYIAEQLRRLC